MLTKHHGRVGFIPCFLNSLPPRQPTEPAVPSRYKHLARTKLTAHHTRIVTRLTSDDQPITIYIYVSRQFKCRGVTLGAIQNSDSRYTRASEPYVSLRSPAFVLDYILKCVNLHGFKATFGRVLPFKLQAFSHSLDCLCTDLGSLLR